jgi:tRNA uridine 5-carbamoylmethylation protein Kti12
MTYRTDLNKKPLMRPEADNPELELAFDYLRQTRRHIFLTGKAGTGKTTFLHRVVKELAKRKAVVAPTGVAAINAKGTTIHSLFQLPFGVLTPDRIREEMPKRRFSQKKIDLLRSLDLLIIDEISMVRADVLDAIDDVLQRYRRDRRPFGGLQLLMIGDLHQLPPVLKPSDWSELSPHYPTAYFFGSQALRKAAPMTIQLKKIYRQSDEIFIRLLNKVRNNQIDEDVLRELNRRYQPDFDITAQGEAEYITLTSHNAAAATINEQQLKKLGGPAYQFSATIAGEFPASMYPNEPHLTFKVGSQVMFNKNDTGEIRDYFNGKLGMITAIHGDEITVHCPDDDRSLVVLPQSWENRKFRLDESSKEIEEDVVGTYEQHPLRLAWAITIHKSQGLTFDRVAIDAQAAFAHGQVYVALSRCRSLEGIVLSTPIQGSSVRTDRVVSNYSKKAEEKPPTEEDFWRDRYQFQADTLRVLFHYQGVKYVAEKLRRQLMENEKSIQGSAWTDFNGFLKVAQEKLTGVAERFQPKLEAYLQQPDLPAENEALRKRLDGAASYFATTLKDELLPQLAEIQILSDNSAIKKKTEELLQELRLLLFVKLKLYQALEDGLDPLKLLQIRADAETDFRSNAAATTNKRVAVPKDVVNRELYLELVRWRQRVAKALGKKAYRVAGNPSLLSITEMLPTEKKTLLAVPKFGRKRFEAHGDEIIEIVRNYVAKHGLTGDLIPSVVSSKVAPKKLDTKYQSLLLYQSGRNVEEIAAARGLKANTIFTHLTHWAIQGEIEPTALVEASVISEVNDYLDQHPDTGSSDLYRAFDGKHDYAVLRLVTGLRSKD